MAKGIHRGFVNPSPLPDYVTGAEAAALLGVKRATLYAYASRGLVRNEPSGRGRGRLYRRDDLERLQARSDARAGHGAVAAGALRWGEPVLDSALTRIHEGDLFFRGHPAVALARSSSFEAVAELLWSGDLPASRPSWRADSIGVPLASLAALGCPSAHPLARLALVVSALAAVDVHGVEQRLDVEAEKARARALIVRMAAVLGATEDRARVRRALASESVASAVLAGFGSAADARAARAIDQVLILLADHELNVSAFAVRVVASAGSDLYACVSAGLAAMSGPLHGGTCDRVEALLGEARDARGARRLVTERMRRGEAIPGFGHPLYPAGDPRVPPLLEVAHEIAPRSSTLAVVRAMLEAGRDAGCGAPAADFGIVAVTMALGLPRGTAAGVFALARAAGWVAHVIEQRAAGFLLRPRARYVGAIRPPPAATITPK